MTATVEMWVIYDHPTDFPERFVARKWQVNGGESWPTDKHITDTDLERLRRRVAAKGMTTPLARSPGDDSKIVETWI